MAEITRVFDILEWQRQKFPEKTDLFSIRHHGHWKPYSVSEYIEISSLLSLGLITLGVQKGDRIATIMQNCPEWNFFDMALMQIGAIQVPVYPTISHENYQYILEDAGVKMIILQDSGIYNSLENVFNTLPGLTQIFSIQPVKGIKGWKEILEYGKRRGEPELIRSISETINPEEIASIIYTSGTTGRPKGVMLSHRNFVSNFLACAGIPGFTPSDRALSFLPLCHVYERMLNYVYQYLGMSIFYADTIEKLIEDIRDVRPHTFATVPRVLEKIYNKIIAKARTRSKVEKIIFFWALRQGHKFELHHQRGLFYDLKLFVADILVFRQWREVLGGHLKMIVCGGASLHPRLARLFWAAKIRVMEGYGLTETSPVIAVYTLDPDGVFFGSVGKVLPGITVKIADDGEILCKGPNVMQGYFNRPERTAEVIDREGWFHTGDIGEFEDGIYLKITDRKKEIFKTSNGKYIAPHVIEQIFRESPFITNIMVIGENRKYVAAIIVPDFEYLRNWCAVKAIPYNSPKKAIRNHKIIHRIGEEVNRFNSELGQTEKIKKFRLLPDEWTVESGELSPTLKLRRKFILEKYSQIIEQTYSSREHNYRAEG
ncbi:MAG: long-chain fatty acid--CoA ligase [Bacteroidota bacterium]